ncbi:MAG TPA: hypothetical protein VH599_19830 [Ktedonobacterales bacterium]
MCAERLRVPPPSLAAQRWPATPLTWRAHATGSAAILAAQRWPATPLTWRATARPGAAVAARDGGATGG